MRGLLEGRFVNTALRELPVDKSLVAGARAVRGACYSLVEPTPVAEPRLVAVAGPALELIGVSEGDVEHPDFVPAFAGNKVLAGSETAAHCYAGHQFGHFSGALGDGAVIYLGEVLHDGRSHEVQLKGAGLTPFSRTADGRKVLRSSIREFLCSEAMHHLGVPTTRAGSIITSDSLVVRDVFYSGRPIRERCTVVMRLAPSFLRFGSFEIFKPRDEVTGREGPSVGLHDPLCRTMLDFLVRNHFPEFAEREDRYVAMFAEVTRRTARLCAHWMSVGFEHGVLNTDNMSALGITLDYGPFGFMEHYDPAWICNGSDDGGRYAFGQQPAICKWNMGKFAEAIAWVVPLEETRAIIEREYEREYEAHHLALFRRKLGLDAGGDADADRALVREMHAAMEATAADFTNAFRALTQGADYSREQLVDALMATTASLDARKRLLKPKLPPHQLEQLAEIRRQQPGFLERFGDEGGFLARELEKMEQRKELASIDVAAKAQKDRAIWGAFVDKLEARVAGRDPEERRQMMAKANPVFVLRNHIAQRAIEAAEKGEFGLVNEVLGYCENPFADVPAEFRQPPEGDDLDLCVTCSS